MKKTDDPIVVEQTFTVSIPELWRAITELNRMTKWFFENIESFEPRVGFETSFTVKNENRIFTHLWRITEVKPKESITYNWRYEGYVGNSFVTFKSSEYEKGSKLTLICQVTEDFPQDIEEFKRESCIGGWNWFIRKRLKEYVEN